MIEVNNKLLYNHNKQFEVVLSNFEVTFVSAAFIIWLAAPRGCFRYPTETVTKVARVLI